MPCVYDRDGIQFYLNFTPGHLVPHVHVYARGREASLSIETGELLIGRLTSGDLRYAQRVIAAGQAKATEIESPSNIAVVDAGGNLVAHVRMDGAWIASIDISINKAFTARALDVSTEDLAANAGPGEQFYGLGPRADAELSLRGQTIQTTRPFLLSSLGYALFFGVPGPYRFELGLQPTATDWLGVGICFLGMAVIMSGSRT